MSVGCSSSAALPSADSSDRRCGCWARMSKSVVLVRVLEAVVRLCWERMSTTVVPVRVLETVARLRWGRMSTSVVPVRLLETVACRRRSSSSLLDAEIGSRG